ncbi:hypothetical protein [Mycolicibacterium pulveris]|uniref:hypothetical protein n=1 Tax=Mycolicibacterium pulveris TaxID=36813 RepID=UPI003CEA1766
MAVSVKSLLMSGISVVGAGAIAIAPVSAPPPETSTSYYHAAPVRVVSDQFVELLAAVQPISATAEPVTLNGAGDAIINAWNRALPWIDYVVELAAYAADFIPFGYFIPIGYDISAQIDIFYFTLIRPVANSFVVDLVAPVVSDPLNLDSYIDGLTTLGSVTWNSLQNFAIAEFNFFFGRLIPPLPPIPPLQSAVEEPTTAMSLVADEEETAVLEEDTEEAAEEPAAETAEATEEVDEVVTELDETEVEEVEEVEEPVEEIEEVSETNEIEGIEDATEIDDADEATEDSIDSVDDTVSSTLSDDTDSDDSDDAADSGDDGDAGDGGEA